MMAFDPGGRVDEQRKTRRMAFRKAVSGKPFQLPETGLRKGLVIPVDKTASDEPCPEHLDRPWPAETSQRAAKLVGFVLVPFALWNRTTFLAERVLGHVITSGIKLMVLAIIIGIGSTLFAAVTEAFSTGEDVTLAQVMGTVLAAAVFLWLGFFGPGIASGLVTGAPQLGAGSAAGTVAAIGAGTVLAGAGGVTVARGVAASVLAGASLAGGTRTAYDLGRMASGARGSAGVAAGLGGVASAGGDLLRRTALRPLNSLKQAYGRGSEQAFTATGGAGAAPSASSGTPEGPAWARRISAGQRLSEARSLTVHALRDGDRGMGSANPTLDQKED